MHYLQKAILDKLRYEQPLTYTAMMPDGIESSHFRYHLKQLMTDKLIRKDDDGCYRLTDNGQREVDYLSVNRTTAVRTPKVITYTLLTHQGRMLLYKKPKEPYRNLWGLIGGKVHFGEDAHQAAKREVYEKTGFMVPVPAYCGVANIIIYAHDQPLSHVVAYVHQVELETLPPQLPDGLGLVFPDDIAPDEQIPDLQPLLEVISEGHFPFERQLSCHLAPPANND